MSYYLRTKHLTLDFEEGKHYDDTNYSVWTDGVMDWRNHYKDQVDLLEPKYGFRFLVDPSRIDSQETDYNSVRELYDRKRKECGYEHPTE